VYRASTHSIERIATVSAEDTNAVLRVVSENVLGFGPFQLNREKRALLKDDETISLSSRAMGILLVLTERPGRIVSSRELLKRVWVSTVVEPGTVRVHVAMLRRFLRDGDPERDYVQNLTGRGYYFAAPVLHKQSPDGAVVNPPVCPPPSTNLPIPIASTVGREPSIRLLTDRMVKHRFVTITGAGGIGKTTVAIRVAEAFAAVAPQEIVFIDLTSIKDARRFPEALALALGVTPGATGMSADVLAFLSTKKMLLILDGCEQVIDAAGTFVESVLRNAPHVHVLVTSRESLGAAGESLYRLGPLDVPPAHSKLSSAQWLESAAVRLFVERAGVHADRPISDAGLPLIAELCRRLEGNPLAIEIAAAHFDILGIEGLNASLQNYLYLSLDGRRTALHRHRTLRAMLDWSYELLSPAEQAILRALSVFTSRFDLQSASAVTGLSRNAVFEYLIGFTRKSLALSGVDDGEIIFRLLDLPRAHALEMGKHMLPMRAATLNGCCAPPSAQ
jgi:predicted ATPase/DNA-binding winged helix-turn-helix (wHTH) protein